MIIRIVSTTDMSSWSRSAAPVGVPNVVRQDISSMFGHINELRDMIGNLSEQVASLHMRMDNNAGHHADMSAHVAGVRESLTVLSEVASVANKHVFQLEKYAESLSDVSGASVKDLGPEPESGADLVARVLAFVPMPIPVHEREEHPSTIFVNAPAAAAHGALPAPVTNIHPGQIRSGMTTQQTAHARQPAPAQAQAGPSRGFPAPVSASSLRSGPTQQQQAQAQQQPSSTLPPPPPPPNLPARHTGRALGLRRH